MANEADEKIDLPTLAEIEASNDVLSIRTNSTKVVRVRERFAVKIGFSIPPQEAENMKFVALNSNVPVPKVYDNFLDPETQKRYIIMDYVPGTDLQKLSPSLTSVEKKAVSKRIKDAIDELHSIPAQGYFGNISRMPYLDGVLTSPDSNPLISGPFESQEQMNNGILTRLVQTESPHYIPLVREMINRTLKGHSIVFTHRSSVKEHHG